MLHGDKGRSRARVKLDAFLFFFFNPYAENSWHSCAVGISVCKIADFLNRIEMSFFFMIFIFLFHPSLFGE